MFFFSEAKILFYSKKNILKFEDLRQDKARQSSGFKMLGNAPIEHNCVVTLPTRRTPTRRGSASRVRSGEE